MTAPPFSARGDGVNDDTDAVQRAIRAAISRGLRGGGAVLRVPAGTYRISGQLKLADDVGHPANGLALVGDGPASFLAFDHKMADGHGDALHGDDARDVVIRDLRIGALPGGVGFNRGLVFHGGSHLVLRDLDVSGAWLTKWEGQPLGYPSGIFLDGGITDVRLLDNELHDIGGDDGNSWQIVVYGTGGASDVHIHGNRCSTGPGAAHRANFGIAIYDSSYVTIDGNEVDGVAGTARDADGYGIMLYGTARGLSHNHAVYGNVIRHTGGAGIYVQDSPYTTVTGNVLEDTARTQSSTSLAIAAIGFNVGPGSISGNVIRGVGIGTPARVPPFGIAIQTCSAQASCASSDGAPRGISVSNNTVEDTAGYGIAIEAGPFTAGDDSTIVGNALINTHGGIGTVGDAPVTGLVIVGNSIVRGPRADSDSAPGIFLGSVSGAVVASNVVAGARGQGIVLHHAASRNIVTGNVVRDFGRASPGAYPAIQVSGEDNLVIGNQTYVGGPP
ncbi:MAG: right-handed parallel beta-helix repeat-containing protein [Polyangiaceae bacterium]